MKQQDSTELVSVIVPVYNVQDYLSRCLESVINNSYDNLEIICINDGSTDGCLEILKSFEKKDSRIRVISKENGGLSSARNEGLNHCTGRLVAFIDSDDWIHKDYFKVLLEYQKKNDYDVVVCNYVRTSDDNALDYDVTERGCYEEKILDRGEYMSVKRHIVGGGNSRLFSIHPPLLIVRYRCRRQFRVGTTADCCGFV